MPGASGRGVLLQGPAPLRGVQGVSGCSQRPGPPGQRRQSGVPPRLPHLPGFFGLQRVRASPVYLRFPDGCVPVCAGGGRPPVPGSLRVARVAVETRTGVSAGGIPVPAVLRGNTRSNICLVFVCDRNSCNNSSFYRVRYGSSSRIIIMIIIIIIIILMVMMMMMMMMMIAFKGAIRDFSQSPHSAANCLQHVRSSGPGRHRVQVTCNTSSAFHLQVSCYVPLGTKGQLNY